MRSLIRNRPLLGAALCFGAGIHCGVWSGWQPALFALATTVVGVFGVISLRRDRKPMVILVLLIVLLGGLLSSTARAHGREKILQASRQLKGSRVFTAVVTGEPRRVGTGWRLPLRVEEAGGRRTRPVRCDGMLPDAAGPPLPGTVLTVEGRWRADFLRRWPDRLERHGNLGTLTVARMKVRGYRAGLREKLGRFKSVLKAVGAKTLPASDVAMLHAMLYGESPAATEQTEAMRRVGVVHLLTVSGLHVGFLVLLLLGIGSALRLPRRLLCCLAMLVVTLYIVMVGARPPAVRAGLMTGLFLLGLARERVTDGLNLLGTAALIMLVVRPLELYDPGFQLSFAACAGIGGLFSRWRRHVPARWRRLADPFLVSLAAQVGVAPVLAHYFAVFSWAGILANPLLVPLGSLAVQLGLVAEVLGAFWLPPAMVLNRCTGLILQAITGLVAWFDRWTEPMGVSSGAWWAMVFLAAGIWLATWARPANPVTWKRRSWPMLAWVLLLSGLILAITTIAIGPAVGPGMTVEFLPVGQGDAIFITAPEGRRILIDGGEQDQYYQVIRPYLRERGIRRLDLVVVTHAHADHLGGITALLKDVGVRVDRVLEPGVLHNTGLYRDFLKQIKTRRIPYSKARRGLRFRIGQRVTGEVLWPVRGSGVYQDLNDSSIVLQISYGTWRVLLTGDAGQAVEGKLIAMEGSKLRAHLLKVGHHGSKDATGAEFLRMVRPRVAVCCVGQDNSFGHPAPETVTRLRRYGATIYRTDRHGLIRARFMKNRLKIYREVTP